MNIKLSGMGMLTAFGRDVTAISSAVKAGAKAPESALENPFTKKEFPCLRVPDELVEETARLPRLRRSSRISHFAVCAAGDALADAGSANPDLTSLTYASSDGGVIYTRRFFSDIVGADTTTGSPLLFPETVYNAPASHVAAQLGIEGEALTFVGGSTCAFTALFHAIQILATGEADRCFVVSAEEADWISCEAYSRWRIVRRKDAKSDRGVLGEGAAALVLDRGEGGVQISAIDPGKSCANPEDARKGLTDACRKILGSSTPDVVVSGASGTAWEEIELGALRAAAPNCEVISPRKVLGEVLSSSSLQQVILAAEELKTTGARSALVTVLGFNGQFSALLLTR